MAGILPPFARRSLERRVWRHNQAPLCGCLCGWLRICIGHKFKSEAGEVNRLQTCENFLLWTHGTVVLSRLVSNIVHRS
ncbi:unnamed protein product [Cylicocyclus nassatus]|uniref:Uncharacterized protein n=1 Tax=Cylicocyclus nassatus TaxID=53992 RepID=A0AA36GT46_CYLNA|nr:unnamed protein product [Cylicocyclus nassatus]